MLSLRAALCQVTQATVWVLGVSSASDSKYVFSAWWLWFFQGPVPATGGLAFGAAEYSFSLPFTLVPRSQRAPLPSKSVPQLWVMIYFQSCGAEGEPQSWWGDIYLSS